MEEKVLAVVGATFAYFTATVQDEYSKDGSNGTTSLQTSEIAGTTTVGSIEGEAGSFEESDIYPGHKEIAAAQVTVNGKSGQESAIAINYKVTENGLGDDATISVYKSDTSLEIGEEGNWFNCQKQTKESESGLEGSKKTLYWEECDSNETKGLTADKKLTGGTSIIPTVESGSGAQEITVGKDIITLENTTKTVYYYIVVEFENDDTDDGETDQNQYMNKKLTGTITITAA